MRSRQPHRTSRLRRIFTVPNIGSVVIGIIVFLVGARWWDTFIGAAVAAAASAAVAGVAWLVWWRLASPRSAVGVIDAPLLGTIPAANGTPAPTLTAPSSNASLAYGDLARTLDAETHGQVLLVSSPSPGQGASTVALNLAISATRAGRRVVLIDGDVDGGGLSRYGRSGAGPGLLDLAAGDADLATASRLWTLDEHHRLPFIPRGTVHKDPEGVLGGDPLADAVGDLIEHADLLLIDVAPVSWNGVVAPLAVHADGTVLVVADGATVDAVERAERRLEAVGAPVVGYVVNRSGATHASPHHPVTRMLKRASATFFVTLLAYVAWHGFQIWNSWRTAERDTLAVAAAAELLALPQGGVPGADVGADTVRVATAQPGPEGEFLTFLVVGSDEGGERADVIILAMMPTNGDPPLMVSLPRDLYLPNRCTQSYTRINANLSGCGDDVNGPTLLALAVEDYTGIHVDHFALFGFSGFERIIDEVDGVEICVDNPVRDRNSDLDLPAGCTQATGAQALGWVRSRHTEELVDGSWRFMPGVNDLTRNRRQQDVILQMLTKLRSFDSPSDLAGRVGSLTGFFTFDDQLGLTEAIDLAWDLRGLDLDEIVRLEVPVADHVTGDGAEVLVPIESFDVVLDAASPGRRPRAS
ncbi:MAG TPA: LCP family protein [Acidimicrobiia bacterium]